jgi:hypothetical protein
VEEHQERVGDIIRVLDLRWGMGLGPSFGMIRGAGTQFLRKLFLLCLVLLGRRMPQFAENLEILGGSNKWNMSFSREVHDWEVNVFTLFFQVLHSVIVRRGSEDRFWWVSSKRGLFKVKSLFNSLSGSEGSCFPWKSVWQNQAPSRAVFFAWSAALGKILTLDNLRKMQVIMVDRCCMYKRSRESVDHLLLHCDVASALWSALFTCFGLS